jgi:hypothetical protein
MRSTCGILALAFSLLGSIAPASAQTSRLGPSITAISAVVRGSSVAYDYKNSVYFVVSAHGDLNGRFISADGALLGQVSIQRATTGFNQYPGVAYSPDAFGGAGGFLVAWHQSLAVGAVVHARMVSTSGAMGPESQISADGSWWEATADIAYSTSSKEFLVVWQAQGIRAQRIGNSGEMLGANIFVTGTDYHRDPSIAYNAANNEFMIVYAGADAVSAYAAARRVAAGSGALVGAETLLTRAKATYITDVAYDSVSNRYLAAWYQGGTFGRVLDAAGNPVTDVVVLGTRFTSYDGLGLAFNAVSGTYLMVAQDQQSYQNGAVQVTAAGVPDAGIVATDIATTNGNYYPKVAARRDKAEWLLSTATGFMATSVQRIGSSGGTGGTPPPPAPPPPPPPCTATPTTKSMVLASGQTTFPIDVNAPSGCAWTATSSVAWLQIFYNATAKGSASVGVTAVRNVSNTPRTGTITIGGQTVTVQQLGFNPAAVTDLDGDGLSDLVWQYRPTGQLASWTMRGNLVGSTQWLNTPGVADPAWRIAGTGDINGDGFADLVWQNSNDGTTSAWLMRGKDVLGASVLNYSPVNPSWKIRGIADLNGDGKADIVWQHDAGWLAVWLMNGYTATATLYLSVPRMVDRSWVIAGAGDVNSDGRADLVWQNQADGRLGVWLMNGATVIDQRTLSTFTADLNWKIHGVGDVSGDGVADLLWQNEATGALGVWYLNVNSVVGQWNLSIQKVTDLGWNMVGPS